MRFDPAGTVKAFATIRFAGAFLDPDEMTYVLGQEPTLAYRKGERYRIDSRGSERVGKTGLWLFSTDKNVPDFELLGHINAIARLVADDPLHPAQDRKLLKIRSI